MHCPTIGLNEVRQCVISKRYWCQTLQNMHLSCHCKHTCLILHNNYNSMHHLVYRFITPLQLMWNTVAQRSSSTWLRNRFFQNNPDLLSNSCARDNVKLNTEHTHTHTWGWDIWSCNQCPHSNTDNKSALETDYKFTHSVKTKQGCSVTA